MLSRGTGGVRTNEYSKIVGKRKPRFEQTQKRLEEAKGRKLLRDGRNGTH